MMKCKISPAAPILMLTVVLLLAVTVDAHAVPLTTPVTSEAVVLTGEPVAFNYEATSDSGTVNFRVDYNGNLVLYQADGNEHFLLRPSIIFAPPDTAGEAGLSNKITNTKVTPQAAAPNNGTFFSGSRILTPLAIVADFGIDTPAAETIARPAWGVVTPWIDRNVVAELTPPFLVN